MRLEKLQNKYLDLSKIANWRLPPGFFREGFFLGVTLVGCGVKLVFWIEIKVFLDVSYSHTSSIEWLDLAMML